MLIIFDLDDTLLDVSGKFMDLKLESAFDAMIAEGLAVTQRQAGLDRLKEINQSSANFMDALRQFIAELKEHDRFVEIGAKRYYGATESNFTLETVPGAGVVLAALKKKHTLALVSKGDERGQLQKMSKAGLSRDFFSAILVTDDYEKKKYYWQLQKKFNVPAHSIIVIGDKVATDLLPAKELGMLAVHMRWGRGKRVFPKESEVDYSITDLRELLKIVEELRV